MSRRRIAHGKMARTLVHYRNASGGEWHVAVRGNVETFRAERGIQPRGLRPKTKPDAQKNAA